MVEILRVKINWTGFTGGPGYTNLYWNEFTTSTVSQAVADGARTKVDAWIQAMKTLLPAVVKLQVDPVVDRVESTTGQLQGFFNTASAAATSGTQAGFYSAPTGACIGFGTNGIRNGRRIRGRMFIVPLAGNVFGTDGTIEDASLAVMRTAANNLVAPGGTGALGVWARPTGPGATDGQFEWVTSATIKDKAAILTSRRD